MKKLYLVFVLFLSAISCSVYAQPFLFNGEAAEMYTYVNLDKPIHPKLSGIRISDGKTTSLQELVKDYKGKPALVVSWNWENDNERNLQTFMKLNILTSTFKEEASIIFVNVNSASPDDKEPDVTPATITKLENDLNTQFKEAYNVPWNRPTAQIIGYNEQVYAQYGYQGNQLNLFLLDKNGLLISTIPNYTGEEDPVLLARLKYMGTHSFPAGKWWYGKDNSRVASLQEAEYEVKLQAFNSTHFKINAETIAGRKKIFDFTYKKTASINRIGLDGFFPDGPFSFYAEDGKTVLMQGDCLEGFINNLTMNSESGIKRGQEIKNFAAYNKAYILDPEKVKTFTVYEEEQKFAIGSPDPSTAWFYQYGEEGKLKKSVALNAKGEAVAEKTYHSNGQLKIEKAWNKFISYYESGQLKDSYGRNEAGKMHGERVAYYDNGKIQTREQYKNGKKDGLNLDYYKNGQLNRQFVYKEGTIVESDEFYENGKTRKVTRAKYTDYFYENGQLFWKQSYTNRSNNQTDILYYPNGNKAATISYTSDGKISCLSAFYTENGIKESRAFIISKKLDELYEQVYVGLYLKGDKAVNTSSITGTMDEFMRKQQRELFKKHFAPNFEPYEAPICP